MPRRPTQLPRRGALLHGIITEADVVEALLALAVLYIPRYRYVPAIRDYRSACPTDIIYIIEYELDRIAAKHGLWFGENPDVQGEWGFYEDSGIYRIGDESTGERPTGRTEDLEEG
jgi:hypothetical protein